ncbi:TetR/AcrR family transcriptional regulator [Clostridium sp. SHJSY1]|uniref:TetR/AcrR family transcriptional regulator n=1 Tax=Clostridium sp. SHJSY1 TaxID=2942483 RepID=UPI00287406E2|nr:TetR/AcrR family transcriptional regulator [Clostridium sp. SHJSY1]MDS0527547.1 TetR/AcrR family transcriptional regulator [Clostridium sp. SHJSY1]
MPKETFFNLSEEKREKIIKKSIKEFGKQGFEKGNIGKIAKEAGVSKGSMYQYFEDKKELYIHCVKESFNISMKYGFSKIQNFQEANIIDLFYEGFKDSWIFLKEERDIYIFLLNLYYDNKHSIKDEALSYILDQSREFMMNLIEINKAKGIIRKDISTESILVFIEGISAKIKEHMREYAEKNHKNFWDMEFNDYEKFLKEITCLVRCALT